jgi:hypothetical protein
VLFEVLLEVTYVVVVLFEVLLVVLNVVVVLLVVFQVVSLGSRTAQGSIGPSIY